MSRLALALSLIALGPSHHKMLPLTGAFWWSLRGVATVFSLLTADLKPTVAFRTLTASHRASDAFKLGEALTRWFAQDHLGVVAFAPLETWTGTLGRPVQGSIYPPKNMPKYFRHSVRVGSKSEPDFLGLTTAGAVHVIESKGRAGFGTYGVTEGVINAARNKALRQVCQIATVNGEPPDTRTACVFAFDQDGTFGQVTDPSSDNVFDYVVSLQTLIRQTYATVLDPTFSQYLTTIDDGYVGIEFMPGWRFGIHKSVYGRLLAIRDEAGAAEFLAALPDSSDEVADPNRAGGRALGADGMILIGDADQIKGRLSDPFG